MVLIIVAVAEQGWTWNERLVQRIMDCDKEVNCCNCCNCIISNSGRSRVYKYEVFALVDVYIGAVFFNSGSNIKIFRKQVRRLVNDIP